MKEYHGETIINEWENIELMISKKCEEWLHEFFTTDEFTNQNNHLKVTN